MGFPGGAVVKNPPASAGDAEDTVSIVGSGRSPRVGSGNPLRYSCLENPMDREAWRATVHHVAKSRTRLSDKVCLFCSLHFAASDSDLSISVFISFKTAAQNERL